MRDCGSGQSGDSCSSDGREIGADINGSKLWSGRKEKWLRVWTSRSGRGELVLLKLQGACSGQVDRRALRATGLGNKHSQGHIIREMETGPAWSLCCDVLRLSLAFFLIGRVRIIAKGNY